MSSIINANQNLKQELDNVKAGSKILIENTIRDSKINFEKRLEEMLKEKNDLYMINQNLMREKEQIHRDYSTVEKSMWEVEALKTEIGTLKKENEKLLLQTHPLTKNQDNPEQKAIEEKLEKKIEELNNKVIELNVQSTQSKKESESLEKERNKLEKEIESLKERNDQLKIELQHTQIENMKHTEGDNGNKVFISKAQQVEIMELRKKNAELTNEVEKMRLEKMESVSEIIRNEAEMELLKTLKTLHSQLEPMRYEIEELKRDKYFERENSNKEKAEIQMKVLSYEHQLESLKSYVKDLEEKNRENGQELREKKWEKNRFQEMEEEKRILEGRVIVYEAMEMVSKNREQPHHVERIQEFERRIHLLLEEENLEYLVNNANVHQLIAMKAYVIELDNKIQMIGLENDHLHKKYQQYKEKYHQIGGENKKIISKHYSMVNAYKGKVGGYERLVMKLTEELERYLKVGRGPSTAEAHYKSVITLYESKILSVHNENSNLKQQYGEKLKALEEAESNLKIKTSNISELNNELNSLKEKNQELLSKLLLKNMEDEFKVSLEKQIPEDHYKGIISKKTKEIIDLEECLNKMKSELDRQEFAYEKGIENYKFKIERLEIDIEQLRLELSENSKKTHHGEEIDVLINKITNLEASLVKSQVSGNINVSGYEKEKRLEEEIVLLKKQIWSMRNNQDGHSGQKEEGYEWYEREIEKLRDELNNNSKAFRVEISELQEELSKQDSGSLKEENKRLKLELERIKLNYRTMSQESQDLMNKIKEAESYIFTLKDEFNNVSQRMNDYLRELESKDQQINEWRIKFTTLQSENSHNFTTSYDNFGLEQSSEAANKIKEKERQLKEIEIELENLRREVDAKLRDIERREFEVKRRESEVNLKESEGEKKERDVWEKMRVIEQRERIVTEESNRLIIWSEDLDRKSKIIAESPTKQIGTSSEINQLLESPNYKEELLNLERKLKMMDVEIEEKIRVLQIKDEKVNKLVKEKSDLTNELEDLRNAVNDKDYKIQGCERELNHMKMEVNRLEEELSKLWKDFDLLKQEIRSKDREISDLDFDKQEIKRSLQLQIFELNSKIIEIESKTASFSTNQLEALRLESEFEEKLRAIEARNKAKLLELKTENEALQRTNNELSFELNRYQNLNVSSNNSEIEAHTATIHSLQNHIRTLEEEVQRKQKIIDQFQDDLKYYQEILDKREQELKKLYESTLMTNQSEFDFTEKERMQNMIHDLQLQLQNKSGYSLESDDEQFKKENLLRMEIERLNGILQSKMESSSEHGRNISDNSYLLSLEETNKRLEEDIDQYRQRLIADFDAKRSIEEYLAILVITFAEVDALRQRISEMEQNFKEEHEKSLHAIMQFNELKEYDVSPERVLSIIQEFELALNNFLEYEERSKEKFVKTVNSEVLHNNQSFNITEELSRLNPSELEKGLQNLAEAGSKTYGNDRTIDFGERSIKNSLRDNSESLELSNYIPNQITSINQIQYNNSSTFGFGEQKPYSSNYSHMPFLNQYNPNNRLPDHSFLENVGGASRNGQINIYSGSGLEFGGLGSREIPHHLDFRTGSMLGTQIVREERHLISPERPLTQNSIQNTYQYSPNSQVSLQFPSDRSISNMRTGSDAITPYMITSKSNNITR